MQLQCRAIDYYSLILVGHGPTLFIFGGAMAYTAYTVPTPMKTSTQWLRTWGGAGAPPLVINGGQSPPPPNVSRGALRP